MRGRFHEEKKMTFWLAYMAIIEMTIWFLLNYLHIENRIPSYLQLESRSPGREALAELFSYDIVFEGSDHRRQAFLLLLLFFLQPHLQHMEVPGPGVSGVKSELQPVPQPWQHQIKAPSEAYSNARSLTHWARLGIKPTSPKRQHRVLNLLSHSGNSFKPFLKLLLGTVV